MYIAHINLAAGFRGGERQTELLIGQLADSGLRQRLVARRGSALAGRCAGVPRLDILPASRHPLLATGALAGVDLVHVHEGRAIQAAWLNACLRGTPYIVTRRVQKGPRRNWRNRWLYGRAAVRVAVSVAIGESLRRLEPRWPCEVIPDATSELESDPDQVAQLRERLGGELRIGNVAALVDSHKGQRQIIEVARRLRTEAPQLVFVLIGGGPDEAMLRAMAADLPNVRFTGHVENVGDHLAALDLFFYPSRHEGLGSVLLDAMQFGLPVVATSVGGIPEIISDGVNGMLCGVDDIDAQSAALLRLVRDPVLRQRIGETNRARAQEYSPAIMAERYLEIYRRLLPAAAGEQQES